MAKLILHIGSPKTGTTTLQHALYSNRQGLLKEGVLYPRPGSGMPNHNELSLLFRNAPPVREFTQDGLRNPQEYIRQAKQLIAQILKQIELNPGVGTVVLSGEYLFFPLKDADGEKLQTFLLSHFDEVRVIVYLRNPVDYFVSMSLQGFKAATAVPGPSPAPYAAILDSYKKLAPLEIVRFDSQNLIEGDVVRDFCARCLPNLQTDITIKRRNETISAEGLYLLNMHRNQIFAQNNNKFFEEGRKLYSIIEAIETKHELRAKPVLKDWVVQGIQRPFAPNAELLLRNYGIDFTAEEVMQFEEPKRKSLYRIGELFDLDNARIRSLTALLLSELAKSYNHSDLISKAGHRSDAMKTASNTTEDKELEFCAMCGGEHVMRPGRVGTANDKICSNCNASIRYRGQAEAILSVFGKGKGLGLRQAVKAGVFDNLRIYEVAIKGPFKRAFERLPGYTSSYFWEDLKPGEVRDGVQCQDLMNLTFEDDSFDLVISTEVMEHVPDPWLAFKEAHRVLKKNGAYIFTIPVKLPLRDKSTIRCGFEDGKPIHYLPEVYHKSGLGESSLVVTDFGGDIFDRLEEIGYRVVCHRINFTNKAEARFCCFSAIKN